MWGDPLPEAIAATEQMLARADRGIEQLTEDLARARDARALIYRLLEAAKAGDLAAYRKIALELDAMDKELQAKKGRLW